LGQELTGLTLGLKFLEAEVAEGTPARKRLAELQEAVHQIGRETHDLALELRPTALDDLGLGAALDLLIRRWSQRTAIPVDYHYSASRTGGLSPDIETTVYRVVQEALTNVARHSGATRVSLVVERRESELVALVDDNGRGFDPLEDDRGARLGLLGMNE